MIRRISLLYALSIVYVAMENLTTSQLHPRRIALVLFGLPFREKPWYRSRIVVPASVAIAAVGFYWAVQRVVVR